MPPSEPTPILTPHEITLSGVDKTSRRRIFILSDGTGETAAQMTKAAMVQFGTHRIYFKRFKNVRAEAQIEAICQDASREKELLVYTLVSPQLRSFLVNQARLLSLPCVDLLGPLLVGLGTEFGYQPKAIAGLLHDVNETYFDRIAAMEYTIGHDDGRDLSGLERADVIILGISRTSKTPLSMYLSHQGWKVANIPLIRGFSLPPRLFELDPQRIVGLTIDAGELATIRRNRLDRLGQRHGGDYAQFEKVTQELEYADQIFRANRRWVVFDVTGKALEETAAEIIQLMSARGLNPSSLSV